MAAERDVSSALPLILAFWNCSQHCLAFYSLEGVKHMLLGFGLVIVSNLLLCGITLHAVIT